MLLLHLLIRAAGSFNRVIEQCMGPTLGTEFAQAFDEHREAWAAIETEYIRKFPQRGRSLETPKKHLMWYTAKDTLAFRMQPWETFQRGTL